MSKQLSRCLPAIAVFTVLFLIASLASRPAHAQVESSYTVTDASLLNQFSLANSNLGGSPTGPGSITYNYLAVTLYPAVTGSYTFGQSSSPVDTVMIVYDGSFDPLQPQNNIIAQNDDSGDSSLVCGSPGYCPRVTANLTGGQPIVLLISTYVPNKVLATPQSFTSNGAGSVSFSTVGAQLTVPDAPTLQTINPGNGQLELVFGAPSDNGGAIVTSYEYRINSGAWTAFSPNINTSPGVISGLTNGTSYSIELRALNSEGAGAASNGLSGTPRTTADAPTNLAPTPGDGQVSVAFTLPSNTGGAAITNYEYSTNGGLNWTAASPAASSSPVTISGLTNGRAYNIVLRALNAAGPGAVSGAVSATPITTPSAPAIIVASPEDGGATVTFTASFNGGTSITNYEYSTDGGSNWTAFSPAKTTSPVAITGLTNGTAYNVALRAVNTVGAGSSSAAVSVTPRTTPGAPTGLIPTAGNGQVTVDFAAPADNGGAAISNYEYSTDGGSRWTAVSPASTATQVVIAGLSNGTDYTISLRAVNAAGSGGKSGDVSATPFTVPDAPTALVAASGDAEVTIAFLDPSFDGGSAITNYEYRIDGGAWTAFAPAVTTSPVTVTGLTNGQTYDLTLRAVNAAGSGAESSVIGATPITTPDAPLITGATPGDGTAEIAFTFASFSGGASISNLEYSIDGGSNWVPFSPAITSDAAPVSITGLQNGTAYPIALREDNAAGSGTASNVVVVTPRTVPDAPTITTVTPKDKAVEVEFAFSPAFNGGAAIKNYEYTIDGGSSWVPFSPAITSEAASITATIAGLTNGTVYQLSLRAVNDAGVGAASSVLPAAPITIPNEPTGLVVTSGDSALSVAFAPPSDDGGAAIANYQYSTDDGKTWQDFFPAVTASPATITGLVNGTPYQVKLRAVNAAGFGAASSSVAGIPFTFPDAPTIKAIDAGDGEAVVKFALASFSGGTAINNMEYSTDGGTTWVAFSPAVTDDGGPVAISGLTNGTAYAIALREDNPAGSGAPSNVVSVIPRTTPDAPTINSITPGDQEVTVGFSAPGFNGGATILNYQYSTDGGTIWNDFTPLLDNDSAPVRITGLVDGTAYSIALRAANEAGPGVSSASQSVIPRTVPNAPTDLIATRSGTSLEIEFRERFNGGAPITTYEYELNGSGNWISAGVTTTPVVITGLVAGTAYTARIRAVNVAGAGAPSLQVGAPSPQTAVDQYQDEIEQVVSNELLRNLRNDMKVDQAMIAAARDRFIESRRNARHCEALGPAGETDPNCGGGAPSGFVPFDVSGSAELSESGLVTRGTFFGARPVGQSGTRRLAFGDFNIVVDENGSLNAQLSGRVAWEQIRAERTMLGFHIGMNVSNSQISEDFEGEAQAFGLSAGPYFVHEIKEELFLSGFATLGHRWTELDVANDALGLDGSFDSSQLSAGMAVTGVYPHGHLELRPSLSLAYGYSESGSVDLAATAFGVTESVAFPGTDVSIFEFSFQPEFRYLMDPAGDTSRYYSVTPSLTCARTSSVDTAEECGGGLALAVSNAWNNGQTRLSSGIDYGYLGGMEMFGANLTIEHRF